MTAVALELCACGCSAPAASRSLSYGRKGFATLACMKRQNGRDNGGRWRGGKTEPYWHPNWKKRVDKAVALLRELGPTCTAVVINECRARWGWSEGRTVNVLAAGHPGLVEKNGVWRARDAV